MNRKGTSTIVLLAEVLVVVLVVFATTEVSAGIGNSETVKKTNLINELEMMINTLVGVEGEAIVEYPRNVAEYTFLLTQGKIVVYKEGESSIRTLEKELFLPQSYEIQGSLDRKARLCLRKDFRSITLGECVDEQESTV